jgi:subtilisin family serine protease
MRTTARRSVIVGAAVATFALLAVATPLQGASRIEPDRWSPSFESEPLSQHQTRSRATTTENSSAVESFYYYHGRPVRLQRSQSELSVRFTAKMSRASGETLVRGLSASAQVSRASRLRGRDLSLIGVGGKSTTVSNRLLADLNARQSVEFAYPAWVDPKTGQRLLLTDEVIARLKYGPASVEIRNALAVRGLTIARKIYDSSDEYVLKLLEPKNADPLAVSQALYQSGLVEWAEPNFVQELQKYYTPNDPLFASQWHLHNTGQGGGTVGADAHLTGAWDIQKGSPETTIAVIDDGVQLAHPDLAQNIYTNRGEIPGNHIDDDGNGYIDDVHGWNFLENNNDTEPFGFPFDEDNHGTAVAGVAAARGNNARGVSGACPNCTVLPVKITSSGAWSTDAAIADAICYASEMADVLNMSWGGSLPSSAIQFSLQYALTIGRDGKGAVAVAAAGNGSPGFVQFSLRDMPPDTYRFRWVYSKDSEDAFDVGADTAWLAWARFPNGELQNFESGSGLPSGWTTGGDARWSVVTDSAHSDEGIGWSHTAKAGKISDNQETYVEVVKTSHEEGDLDFLGFVSSEMGEHPTVLGDTLVWACDGLRLWVDKGNDGTYDWSDEDLYSGVPPAGLSYPAANPQAIAVGASTSFDRRAPYSQFGPELDLVSPSSGSVLTEAIVTTDRTGPDGYDESGDYYSSFGGTSSAAPLAAGVAGLVLSRNPGLTQAQVRQILEGSADKISPDLGAYDSVGHSDRYGYGRINAQRALSSTPLPSVIAFSKASYRVGEGRTATVKIKRSGNVSVPASVNFATVGRAARAVFDFAIVSRKISFAPGESSKKISIPTRDDKIHEPAEKLSLRLWSPSPGAVVVRPRTSALTIVDNDVRHGKIASASLSRTVFKRGRAGRVKLVYRFSRPSGSFRYVLSLRKGAKWKVVEGARNIGDFKGSHTLAVRALFARERIVSGRYRLLLFADTNSKRLSFTVR